MILRVSRPHAFRVLFRRGAQDPEALHALVYLLDVYVRPRSHVFDIKHLAHRVFLDLLFDYFRRVGIFPIDTLNQSNLVSQLKTAGRRVIDVLDDDVGEAVSKLRECRFDVFWEDALNCQIFGIVEI